MQEKPASNNETPHAMMPLRPARTLRYGIRHAWDALGLVCGVSLTFMVCAVLPAMYAWRLGGPLAAIAVWPALGSPLYAGACRVAHTVFEHDEPTYAELWRGFGRLYGRAVLLGAIQAFVGFMLTANIIFYLSRGHFVFMLLALAFGYLLLFWLMNCLYHAPLLVAASAGLLHREDGAGPRLLSVFRNGFLLTLSAPGFTFLFLIVIMAASLFLTISGVGMALLAPGLTAFMTTQATRDQLVRYGILPTPPDPDLPATDDGWKI